MFPALFATSKGKPNTHASAKSRPNIYVQIGIRRKKTKREAGA